MSIDVQPPNYSGLVALAGKSAALNLQPTGALGLQALQQQQANDAALRQNAMQQAQLQQAGQLGLLANQTQQQGQAQQAQYQQGLLADQQQKNVSGAAQAAATLQQTANNNQSKLGMDLLNYQQTGQNQQATQTIAEQKNILDAHKQMMDQINKDSATELSQKGAFASYLLVASKNAATPDAANQVRTDGLKEAVSKGYMTQAQADASAAMPMSQFNGVMGSYIVAAGQGADFKAQQAATNPTTAAGTTEVRDPTTGNVVYRSTTTPATQTELEKKSISQGQMLNTLNNLTGDYREKYFTQYGKFSKGMSETADTYKDAPYGIGTAMDMIAQATTGMNKPQREQYITDSTQYLHSAGQMFQSYIQQLAGSRVSQDRIDAFERLFANPSMSPVEYRAGMEQLIRDIGKEKGMTDEEIRKGLNTTPPPVAPATGGNPAAAGMQQHLASFKNPDGSAKYSPQQITDYINTLGKK